MPQDVWSHAMRFFWDFLKYFLTRYQTVPRAILRFRQDMNSALARLLFRLCFRYALSSVLAESANGRMFTSPPLRCNLIVPSLRSISPLSSCTISRSLAPARRNVTIIALSLTFLKVKKTGWLRAPALVPKDRLAFDDLPLRTS